MGKVVEKKTTKKKKGRPSLLDLQKRSLKDQQPQLKPNIHKIPNPSPDSSSTPAASVHRSTRRNPNPNPDPATDDDDEERSCGKRRGKKLNLVGEDISDPDDDHSAGSNPRKRKIGSIAHGSAHDDKDKKFGASTNPTINQQGSKLNDGPSTPLPDQKLLLFILDRLQKKDTYGVFSDPVDLEELPDYHEVIEHPMDFSTIRKKLANGSYGSLEQFEKDVFLLCSNAMQYNSPDTIYFRQARSIQELAKKDFDNLRQDSDDNEPQPEPKVVKRGRPPTKHLKRPPGRPPLERANSDFSEVTPPTTSGVNNSRSNSDTRKGTPLLEKAGSADLFLQSIYGSRYGETYIGWSSERYKKTDDMTGSASKGILMKHGKKQIILDENRRNTYKQSFALAYRQEPSVLATFDGETKQLIAVGLHTEYGYARSLARFATRLGPVAWKVASKRIQRCLPTGIKFGPGWVGENEAAIERLVPHELPTSSGQPSKSSSSINEDPSSSTPTKLTVEPSSDKSAKPPQGERSSRGHTSSMGPKPDDGGSSNAALSAFNDVGPSSNEASTSSYPNANMSHGMSTSSVGAMKVVNRLHDRRNPTTKSHMNGLNGSYGINFAAQMGKMIGSARPTILTSQPSPSTVNNGSGEAKLPENSGIAKQSECFPNARGPNQKVGPTPPDLNVRFQTSGSPHSHSGRSDSVQPDLALQL